MGELITRRFLIERSAAGEVERVSVRLPPKPGRRRWRPIWTRKNVRRVPGMTDSWLMALQAWIDMELLKRQCEGWEEDEDEDGWEEDEDDEECPF